MFGSLTALFYYSTIPSFYQRVVKIKLFAVSLTERVVKETGDWSESGGSRYQFKALDISCSRD